MREQIAGVENAGVENAGVDPRVKNAEVDEVWKAVRIKYSTIFSIVLL